MLLGELSDRLGCVLHGDPQIEITGLSGMEQAVPGQLTFLANPKYASKVKTSRASAILVTKPLQDLQMASVVSENPYHDFARALEFFYTPPRPEPGVHPLAFVHPLATIGPGASSARAVRCIRTPWSMKAPSSGTIFWRIPMPWSGNTAASGTASSSRTAP
jgi:UDP-3-O-[3-hydroxymyristoyl] glucosamine N-acyltransferase